MYIQWGKIGSQTRDSTVNPRASERRILGRGRGKESDINFATWNEGFECDFRPFASFSSVQCVLHNALEFRKTSDKASSIKEILPSKNTDNVILYGYPLIPLLLPIVFMRENSDCISETVKGTDSLRYSKFTHFV